jgi:hypothetical protein
VGRHSQNHTKAVYGTVGKASPEWIDRLVEQDQIEAHVDEGRLKLRGFFVRVINDQYLSNVRALTPKEYAVLPNGVMERFAFCMEHEGLIPYLHCHSSQRTNEEIVITADIFDELRRVKIESLTSLKDLASMIGGKFESCSRKIFGVKTKAVAGPIAEFRIFLKMQVEDNEES